MSSTNTTMPGSAPMSPQASTPMSPQASATMPAQDKEAAKRKKYDAYVASETGKGKTPQTYEAWNSSLWRWVGLGGKRRVSKKSKSKKSKSKSKKSKKSKTAKKC